LACVVIVGVVSAEWCCGVTVTVCC